MSCFLTLLSVANVCIEVWFWGTCFIWVYSILRASATFVIILLVHQHFFRFPVALLDLWCRECRFCCCCHFSVLCLFFLICGWDRRWDLAGCWHVSRNIMCVVIMKEGNEKISQSRQTLVLQSRLLSRASRCAFTLLNVWHFVFFIQDSFSVQLLKLHTK